MIKSSFSDAQLDALKDAAKQKTNFKLNFKNIKRNSAGLISSIYVGQKKNGRVIVTSSPVK